MNHVAKLPTATFQVIQEYSEQRDYRHLINSNSAAFKTVKQETAYYSLQLSKNTAGGLRFIAHIIDNVKDKSKQIEMSISNLDQSSLINYAQYYNGIKSLSLDGSQQTFNSQLSFHMFANICYLTLIRIKGIRQAHFYLDKTIKLELRHCDFEEILDWRTNHSMKEVIIHGCDELISFPTLEGIPVVTITTHKEHLNHFQVGGQTKLSFDGRAITLKTLQHIASQPTTFFDSLTYLRIRCPGFPMDFQDYSFCQNIPVLYLKNNLGFGRISESPYFPRVFNGRKITLSYFNLSRWPGESIFSNVEFCRLLSCYNLLQLPEMPKLKTLWIESCHQLSSVPSMLSLTQLLVLSCSNVSSISCSSLCLEKVEIDNCDSLEYLFGFDSVQILSIRNCCEIKIIPNLSNLRDLDLRSCKKLDFKLSLEQCATPKLWNTVIRLSDLSITDFSFCRDLSLLQLINLPHLKSLTGTGNIDWLMVEDCQNLITTEGLEGVIGQIDICRCPLLKKNLAAMNI
jgi:hypothetical protein